MAACFGMPLAWIPGFATWLVVWLALAAATVVLVVLLRTRWRETKAWKKCALLSLWVHVLLACLAANVRIGLGGSGGAGIGPGSGGPIRVAIVSLPPAVVAPQVEMPTVVEEAAANEADDAEVDASPAIPDVEVLPAAELSAAEPPTAPEPAPDVASD